MAKKSQSIQRNGKLESVEVISNDFIKEKDIERRLRATTGLKRGW